MSGFSAFAAAFCVVCVVTGGLFLLLPSGGLEKAVRYLLGLLFLCCVVSAIPGVGGLRIERTAAAADRPTEEMNLAAAEMTFRLALQGAGINFSEITVCTDKNESGGIIITKVIVCSPESEEYIRQTLGGEAGSYEVEVIHE